MQILGVSANNPFSQKTFADSLQLPFPLLSDFPDLKTIRSYGGLSQEFSLTIAQRYFFLVDLRGIVRGKWRGTSTDVFPTEPILKVARELPGKR